MKVSTIDRKDSMYLRPSLYVLLVVWFLLVMGSFLWNYADCQERYHQLASLIADTHFDKEKALRLWVASRGGVYVPIDETNRPNPLLEEVKGRDVISSGIALTLIPGFHLVRQLREEFPHLYKVRGATVGLNPLRPENAPDQWQQKALAEFQAGKQNFGEFTEISGEPYFRLMRPHYAQKDCLKCHGKQGYKEGDILGGIEVSLPLTPFKERQAARTAAMAASHGAILVIGFLGIVIGVTKIGSKEKARDEIHKALLHNEERYRQLVEGATDIIYQTDSTGAFTFVNPRVLDVLGYSEAELVGRLYPEFVAPGHKAEAQSFWEKAIERQAPTSYFECPLLSKNGAIVWLGQNIQVMKTEDQITGFQAVARDMTERRKTEECLRESEARYKSLYSMIRLMCDNVSDLIWAKNLEGKFIFVNRAICEKLLIARDTEEPIGKTDLYFAERERTSHPEDPGWHTFGEICMNSDEVVKTTMEKGRFDEFGNVKGEFLRLDVYKTPLFNEHGEMIGVVGSGRDVTRERWIEESLRESEARYRELFENASDFIYTHDLNGNYTSVNHVGTTLLGYSEDEFLRLNFRHIGDPEYLHIAEQNLAKKLLEGVITTEPYEVLARCKDGTPIWFEIKSRLIKQEDRPVAVHGIARNVTERKSLEKALQQAQSTYRSVVEAFDGIIHVSSPDHVIEFANDRLVDQAGRDPVGERCYEIVHGLDNVCPWCTYGAIPSSETYERELFSPRDGRWYDSVSSPFYHADGRISRIFLMRDIDAQKRAEAEQKNLREQLVQAQKMESIGTLAGGIAHDFNNLLQVVLGHSQLLLNKKDPNAPEYVSLKKITLAARHAADLVKGLLAFSRKAPSQARPLDLNHQVEEVKSLLERTIPKMIRIELSLGKELPVINADPGQIEQILMNLGINARDAMTDGGVLTIETNSVFLDEEFCKKHVGASPGTYCMLAVSDTGHGMEQEILEHIFEPFYTTKEVGKGTGLGLAMVYGIVKQHSGFITCESHTGVGTTLRVYFPAVEGEKEAIDIGMEKFSEAPGGIETILMVDDEELVRDLGSDYLREFGYTVLTASNGKEALEIYRIRQAEISIVLLDLIMPEMGGRQCLTELFKINPQIKVIIVSGYSSGGTEQDAAQLGATGFVEKPYDLTKLVQTIRTVLDLD